MKLRNYKGMEGEAISIGRRARRQKMEEGLVINEPAGKRASGSTLSGMLPTKTSISEFTEKATLVKNNDRYEVYDLSQGNLVISMTVLHGGKSTVGHSHNETEEIYLIVDGKGEIQLGDSENEDVVTGDIVIIPGGIFHSVLNTGNDNLTFLCFFKKYPGRGE